MINIYDEAPYPLLSHSATHPDRAATIATLLGMEPAPVESCRVLELGCAGGGNLIPMAYSLPGSEFVGVDLSPRQITRAREMLAALNLPNVRLENLDLLDITGSLGRFDYIIAHGLYSWVAPAVRDKLLDICHRLLKPNGVAYISYNTYPGWHLLGTVRQMLLYHTRHLADPRARVAEARTFLDFLARSITTGDNAHSTLLHAYVGYVNERSLSKEDEALLHDELSEINDPVYFYQFAEHAAGHGLQYLGDVNFSTMLATNFPAEVTQTLRRLAKNTIEIEQYLDYLRNRVFRQSLLCRQEINLSARLSPERLARFYFASSARPESSRPDLAAISVEKFQAANGAALSIDHPVTKAALLYLARIWPRCVSFETLLAEAQALLPPTALSNPAADAQLLGANLLKGYTHNERLVEFHAYCPAFTTQIGDRPVASPVARYQAARGHEVTNLRHERVALDGTIRALLPHLDGHHDHATLATLLAEKEPLKPHLLPAALRQIAQSALLV